MLQSQNRNLIYFFIFIVISFAIIFYKTGLLTNEANRESVLVIQNKNDVTQDQMGDSAISLNDSYKKNEEQKSLNQIFFALRDCFSFKANTNVENKGNFDSIAQMLQIEFGNFSSEDKWINWRIKLKDGQEQLLKLELVKNNADQLIRTLRLFSITKEGDVTPFEIQDEKLNLPSDQAITQILKSGEVVSKEKSGVLHFAQNLNFEFIEKDNLLTKLELKGEKLTFNCENARINTTCSCNK